MTELAAEIVASGLSVDPADVGTVDDPDNGARDVSPDEGGGNLTNTFGDILAGGKYAFANEIGEVKD